MTNFDVLAERITRLETRLVRGFNELGVDVTQVNRRPEFVDGRIVLPSLDVSVATLVKTAVDNGCKLGYDPIVVEYDGQKVLTL
jgi:hypothetical protein